eukprot:scaffold15134_cov34-Tisochrysis_lutea.AAC.1
MRCRAANVSSERGGCQSTVVPISSASRAAGISSASIASTPSATMTTGAPGARPMALARPTA